MEWIDQTTQISIFTSILHLLIVLQADSPFELPLRMIGELQTIQVLLQLCINEHIGNANKSFHSFNFLNLDSKLLGVFRDIPQGFIIFVIVLYQFFEIFLLIKRLQHIRKGLGDVHSGEYSLMLFHSFIWNYYINVIGLDFINNSNLDRGLIIVWIWILVVNNIFGVIGARFYIIRMRSMNLCAARTHSFNLDAWTFKFLDVLVRNFLSGSIRQPFRLGIAILYLAKRTWTLARNEFYDLRVQMIFWIMHGVQIAFGVGAVLQIIAGLTTNFTLFVSVLLSFVLARVLYSKQMKLIIEWAAFPLEKCKSPGDFEMKLNIVENLLEYGIRFDINRDAKLSQLLFKTIFSDEIKSVRESLKLPDVEEIRQTKIEDYEIIIARLQPLLKAKIYKAYIAKHPRSDFLKLSYCAFQAQTATEYKYSTLIDLISLANLKDNRVIAILAEKFLNRIYKATNLKIIQEESIDARQVVEYVRCSSTFSSILKKSAASYHKFWQEPHAKITALDKFNQARRIQKDHEQIESLWTKMKIAYSHSIYTETILYALYLLLIRNNPGRSLKLFEEKRRFNNSSTLRIQKSLLERCLNSGRSIVIIIERSTHGKERVLFATKTIEFFGYPRTEIESKGIDILIPNYYRLGGTSTLIDYIEKLHGTILGTNFHIYLKKRSGILYAVDAFITTIAIKRGFTYMITMEVAERMESVIMCTPTGAIEGWSEPIDRDLNLLRISKDNHEEKKELNMFDVFFMTVPSVLDFTDSKRGSEIGSFSGKRASISKRMSTKRVGNIKTTNPLTADEDIEMVYTREGIFRYIGKKISEATINKNIILKLTKVSEEENEYIPEERTSHSLEDSESGGPQDEYSRMIKPSETNFGKASHTLTKYTFLRRKTNTLKNDEDTVLRVDSHDQELEKLLHNPSESKALVNINRGIVLFILLAIAFSLGYYILGFNRVANIPFVTQVFLYIAKRHLNLWTWVYFNAITTQLVILDLWDDRQGSTKLGYFQINAWYWPILSEMQMDYLGNITERLPYYEDQFRKEFFLKFPIKRTDTPGKIDYVDIFQLDKLFADNTNKMRHYETMPIESLAWDDPRLTIVVNNVLDDHYIMEEYWYQIIIDDVNYKLNLITTFAGIISFVLLGFSVILQTYSLTKQKSLLNHRLSLAESLNKITSNETEPHLRRVAHYIDYFENEEELASLYEQTTRENNKRAVEREAITKKQKKGDNKFSNSPLGKLNYKLYFLSFLILSMLITILLVSYINYIMATTNRNSIVTTVNNAIQAGLYMNQLVTISNTLYAYYRDGNVTLKNRPYQEVWDECVSDLAHAQDFYLSLLDQVDPDLSEILLAHFTTDLCKLINDGTCFDPIKPIVRKGAFGMYSFIFQVSLRVKTIWDQSDKSFTTQKNLYYTEDFINMEWVEYMYPAETNMMLDVLQEQIRRTVERYRSAMTISVGCFVAGFLFFMLFIWGSIKRGLRDQRNQVYEVMRIIPFAALKYNISVKTFWNKFSKLQD